MQICHEEEKERRKREKKKREEKERRKTSSYSQEGWKSSDTQYSKGDGIIYTDKVQYRRQEGRNPKKFPSNLEPKESSL
jgi:hypothetical protein